MGMDFKVNGKIVKTSTGKATVFLLAILIFFVWGLTAIYYASTALGIMLGINTALIYVAVFALGMEITVNAVKYQILRGWVNRAFDILMLGIASIFVYTTYGIEWVIVFLLIPVVAYSIIRAFAKTSFARS